MFKKLEQLVMLTIIFGFGLFFIGCQVMYEPFQPNQNVNLSSNANPDQVRNMETNTNILIPQDDVSNLNLEHGEGIRNWRQYVNTEFGFSFRYPEEWFLMEDNGMINVRSKEIVGSSYKDSFKLMITKNSFEVLKEEIEKSDVLSNDTALIKFHNDQVKFDISGHEALTGTHSTAIGVDERYYYVTGNNNISLYFTFINTTDSINTNVEDAIRTLIFEI